jgi:4-alpha-glucanotransferase
MTHFSSTWLQDRASGVLAHISSLPGEFGIGNFGAGARFFVDFLRDCGIKYWQICPLGPTGYGDSPYQSFSSFAGNPYFIDLTELVACGMLSESEVTPLRSLPAHMVDYGELYTHFWSIIACAHRRFVDAGDKLTGAHDYGQFRRQNAAWLTPYCVFMALKAHHGGRPWTEWPAHFRRWRPGLETELPDALSELAARHAFTQYLFFKQWQRLRDYARERGVEIIGDVPIFVAMDSADTWQHREVFRLDESGKPVVCAGVPPDYFSEFGQFWGNPLYDWEYLERTGYSWWIERLRAAFSMYDVIRLDHFRGFDTYWEIPSASADARQGNWRQGPGIRFFDAVKRALPNTRIIAEDLGYITEGVATLRRAAGFPGMKILQFGYGHDDNNVNLPHFFPRECVVYTGTHDNDTTCGWLASLPPELAVQVFRYFDIEDVRSAWPLIKAAFASTARLAVIPVQDLLDLPSEARMNRPGTAQGNWRWRFTLRDLELLATRKSALLRSWNQIYDRNGLSKQREYSAPPERLAVLAH